MTADRPDIRCMVEQAYGLSGPTELTRLPGENENFLVHSETAGRFVLKLTDDEYPAELFDLENAVVDAARSVGLGVSLPVVIPTVSGQTFATLERPPGPRLRGRLLEFVDGIAWNQLASHSSDLRFEFGRLLGNVDKALNQIDLPAARRSHPWDLAAISQHRDSIRFVPDADRRKQIESSFDLFEPLLSELSCVPHSIIHGDANDENVLVKNGHIVGLLDFGDCLFNPTVCELAIGLTYAMMHDESPLSAGAEIVAGYQEAFPRSTIELRMLFSLVMARLCNSVIVAAVRRSAAPEHPTWFATESNAWQLFDRFSSYDPDDATVRLTKALA